MSSDIICCLQLDKNFTKQVIVVKEINGCDSSFINSCVLSHCIKNKNPVVIISAHNSMKHYQNVGLKMNYNLQKSIESGLIEFYNIAEESVDRLLTNNNNLTLEQLFQNVKHKVLAKQQNGDVNIILDGVSHLFDLQYSLKEVNEFCKWVFNLIEDNSKSFMLCICNNASEDDVTHTMAKLLAHKAHTVIEVETLPSGWSADVSGHITVKCPGQKFDNEHMFTLDLKTRRYLFKLFDRGVKLLAPGTV